MADTKKNRVAIYVRVSTLHQVDKDSLPMQKNDLIAYAKLMLGTDDYVIFDDAGYSGKNTDRPKFQEMMGQLRSGLFTHLLVWKIDRISRNLLDFASMYNELKELGVTFVSKNEQFDTSSAMGEAMLKIILVFAELERSLTSERVSATMVSRASNGLWNGGRVSYGYNYDKDTKTFAISPDEATVVRVMHDKYEETPSLVQVTRFLNDKGYRTKKGYLWSPATVLLVLRSMFNCGDYVYNVHKDGDRRKVKKESEWITIPNHHPAIISHEQKERVLSMLSMNRRLLDERGAYSSTKNTHIFSGLMFCGNCGKPMGASLQNKKDWSYSKYSCSSRRKSSASCDGKATSDPIVGGFVFNYILNMLKAQNSFDSIHSPADLQARLLLGDTFLYIDHIDKDGLNDLYNVLSSGDFSGTIYGKGANIKTFKNEVESELSSLRKEKQRLERAMGRLTDLYLYSDDAMSQTDFMVQKYQLVEQLDEINEQIGLLNSSDWQQSVSDEEFIERASEFIIAKKLADRNFIYYKNLATSVEPEVLKTFVVSIIDKIVMDSGKVKQIVFRNGLSHTFIFKSE